MVWSCWKMVKENKNGSVGLVWIINMMVVITVLITVSGVVISTLNKQVETNELGLELLSKRIIYSPLCFAYQDPYSGRAEVGVLDYNKVSEETLKECFSGENNNLGILVYIDNKNFYYNEKYYNDTEPITFADEYLKYSKTFIVKVIKNNKPEFMPMTIVAVSEK